MHPTINEVSIIARDADHALDRLRVAARVDEMPKEIDFKIASVELIQEDVPLDEEELEMIYASTSNKRTLN